MTTTIPWAEKRAAAIKTDLRAEYGRGWDKLSRTQRNALKAEQVHLLLQTQDREDYLPAQAMAASVLAQLGVAAYQAAPDFDMEWAQQRASFIDKTLRREYGAGWDKLSRAQQDALKMEQVLNLLLGQREKTMEAARQLVRTVLVALGEPA